MKAYVNAVVVNVSFDDTEHGVTILVDADGNADLDLRYKPVDRVVARQRRAVAFQACCDADLVRWQTVGPNGGEDTILMATDELMAQLAPAFALRQLAP